MRTPLIFAESHCKKKKKPTKVKGHDQEWKFPLFSTSAKIFPSTCHIPSFFLPQPTFATAEMKILLSKWGFNVKYSVSDVKIKTFQRKWRLN